MPVDIDWFIRAVVEAVEVAVINSLCAATTMTGRDGNVRHALPIARVVELARSYRVRG